MPNKKKELSLAEQLLVDGIAYGGHCRRMIFDKLPEESARLWVEQLRQQGLTHQLAYGSGGGRLISILVPETSEGE